MSEYQWDATKNEWLLRHRRISFEQIVWHIAQGHVLDILTSDKSQHKGQEQFVVNVNGYAYLVPFVKHGGTTVLKTIFPSRKLTRQYLGGKEDGTPES